MRSEPPITRAQRAYLAAFVEWLRCPTDRTVRARQRALAAVCNEAAIEPGREPEQRERSARVSDQPRPTKVVLAEALNELQAREAKLRRLEQELAENRAAIKVLRKLIGDAPVRPAAAPPAGDAALSVVRLPAPPSAVDRETLVLRVIGAEQPCARSTLLQRTDLGPGALKSVLDRLRDGGKIEMVGQKGNARYVLAENREVLAAALDAAGVEAA